VFPCSICCFVFKFSNKRARKNFFSVINTSPEALAHSTTHSPSKIPLSCPVAPPSQRELHKDGGGGGGGMARRARAARAPKAKSCTTSCGTSSATSSAASFACSSFTCNLREALGAAHVCWAWVRRPPWPRTGPRPGVGLASGSPRAAAHLFLCPLKCCVGGAGHGCKYFEGKVEVVVVAAADEHLLEST